jgi:LPS O-antigen subunit length determinant protein (WzzB/FepE family)
MTKAQVIKMIEDLNAKRISAKKALKIDENIKSRAATERFIKNINSVCDRLAFNFNMLPASQSFLESTIAEAELFLQS